MEKTCVTAWKRHAMAPNGYVQRVVSKGPRDRPLDFALERMKQYL
jgi:hypothetical protein